MNNDPAAVDNLGIIAGSQSLPLVAARQARARGVKQIVAVAFENETNHELADLVDKIVWVRVGQLNKLIAAFTGNGVQQCIMVGQVAPKNLFDLRPDLRAVKMLLGLREKNAHTIFAAIADELAHDGVTLIAATPWLESLMPQSGFRLGPALTSDQVRDVSFGFRRAKEIAQLEIGQTVVVKDGAVLAVEAFEGTDACLQRGGELAGNSGGGIAVKVAKEDHDMRFDIPCLGVRTLQTCVSAKLSVLAFEAGKTLLLDQEAVARVAHQERISVVALPLPST